MSEAGDILKKEPSTTELIRQKLHGQELTFDDVRHREVAPGISLDMLEASLREEGFTPDTIESFRQRGLSWVRHVDRAEKRLEKDLRLLNRSAAAGTGFSLGVSASSALLGDTHLPGILAISGVGIILGNLETLAGNLITRRLRRTDREKSGTALAKAVLDAKR